MSEIKLTREQQAVVDNRGGTLLVSAAAGSGKTRVLIDRVLKRVSEEQCNIDDFLMITFTQAAASELRGKLIARLSEQLALRPDDRHLQKQMSRVYLAQISTIHALCSTLLREYAHSLELPADFRICDEQEAASLQERTMEALMEDAYRVENTEIAATLDMLGAGRDDRALPQLILKCYDALSCRRDPQKALQELRKSLQYEQYSDIGESIWGRYLINELHIYLQGCLQSVQESCRLIAMTDCLEAYRPAFDTLCEILGALLSAETWEALRSVPRDYGTLKRIMKCPEPEKKERVQATRKRVMSGIESRMEKFSLSSEEALADLQQCAPALRGLLHLCEEFSKRYETEKRRRHLLDYNDLEHETLRLLYGRSQTPTAAAKEISERFVELMIDEYQDTNEVQDAIFAAISKKRENLFFVGDVKQSIYRFRLADPEIFLKKYKGFASYEGAENGQPRKILLSDNFRSVAPVLEAANDVFRLTMTERVGGLRYADAEALRPNQFTELETPAVELHCIDTENVPKQPPIPREEVEAEFVARRISEMLKHETIPDKEGLRLIRPEDIVILLRSLSRKASVYQAALQRYGIRSVCGSENLFKTEEIGFLTALLQIIDNPHQDIPLLTVLLSPVVRFSIDALAYLRAQKRDGDIYDALCASEYGQDFLQTISHLRDTAQQGSLHALLDEIDETLPLREVYEQRNLDTFLTLADSFESSGRFGLSPFLRHIRGLQEKGLSADDAPTSGAVRLMTVHKSKGLEFPVVFLADLCKRFNIMDSTDTVLIDTALGIGAKLYDPVHCVSYPTVARSAISDRIRRENMSEEMRVLYVAMTRPQYRLVMTCCAPRLKKKIEDLARDLTVPAMQSQIEGASSLADWVLMTALTHTESGEIFSDSIEARSVSEYPWRITMSDAIDLLPQESFAVTEEAKQIHVPALLSRNYAHETAQKTPSKLTATQLKGRNSDAELSEVGVAPILHFSKPRFDKKGLSATERGTAIHLAMQYLRYDVCVTQTGVKSELSRMVSERFLTQEQADSVPARKLLRFFQSDLGKRLLNAEKLVREFKFSILEDGGIYDASLAGEKLLLQGVTDCCIIEDGRLSILDFKSDRIQAGEEPERAEYYRGQIEAYARALSRIFGLSVKDRILYFFATDNAYYL